MKKLVSLVLIVVLLLSVVACNTKAQFEVDLGDWYDMERQYFPISSMDAVYGFETVSVTDEYVITRRSYDKWVSGSNVVYDSLFKLNFDGSYSEMSIKGIKDKLENKESSFIYAVTEFNGSIYALVNQWGIDPTKALYYFVEIDLENESISELIELTDLNSLLVNEMGLPYNVIEVNNQLVFHFSSINNEHPITIIKMNPDFSCEMIDVSSELSSYNVEAAFDSYMIDENHLLLECSCGDGPYEYFALNINNNRVEHIDYSYVGLSVFESRELNVSCANNNYCKKDSYGVYRYDYSDKEFQEVFNFDNCNVNRWEMQQPFLSLIYMDEDTYVFGGSVRNNGMRDYNYELIRLSKSDVDLREGKTILTAVDLAEAITPNIAEAVYQFNENNPNYYVVMFDDFSILNYGYHYIGEGEDDVRVEEEIAGRNQLSTDIVMTLLSGEGPDIFLNSYEYTTINNPNCLLDLTPYITGENGINTEEYFTPIFANTLNGVPMYQLPLTINLNCTFGRFIPTTEDGLSFEDYLIQVNTVSNGFDYIAATNLQIEAFDLLMNSISDEIIVDGTVNLDVPNFYGIVDYCENIVAPDDTISYSYNMDCMTNMSFASYINRAFIRGDNPIVLTGFPSATAEIGPTIHYTSSAAIAASCENPDGAWEFLKTLISYESQCKNSIVDYVFGNSDPVNIAAFETCSIYAVNDTNDNNNRIEEDFSIIVDDATIELINEYEDIIENSSVAFSLDPAIIAIMNEEIQAYFVGDKTLDEVMEVIENRVQTLLDERG